MIRLKSYKELREYVRAAARRDLRFLIVTGIGGISKSFTIQEALAATGSKHLILSGHLTPASMYEQLYNHRDETVFINDIDMLFRNSTMVAIFKQLCETKETKKLQYNSKTPLMADMPRSFETKSNVIVDCNKLPTKDEGLKALFTRGVHVSFEPTTDEVLANLRSWATDKLVYAFIAQLAHMASIVDLRKYVVAVQLKQAKLDWRRFLIEEMGADPALTVALELMQSKLTWRARVKEWIKRTGKSESSFTRAIAELKKTHATV